MKCALSPLKTLPSQWLKMGHPTILAIKFRQGQKRVMILICQAGRPIFPVCLWKDFCLDIIPAPAPYPLRFALCAFP
jgi:hypothetical protein